VVSESFLLPVFTSSFSGVCHVPYPPPLLFIWSTPGSLLFLRGETFSGVDFRAGSERISERIGDPGFHLVKTCGNLSCVETGFHQVGSCPASCHLVKTWRDTMLSSAGSPDDDHVLRPHHVPSVQTRRVNSRVPSHAPSGLASSVAGSGLPVHAGMSQAGSTQQHPRSLASHAGSTQQHPRSLASHAGSTQQHPRSLAAHSQVGRPETSHPASQPSSMLYGDESTLAARGRRWVSKGGWLSSLNAISVKRRHLRCT